MEPHPTDKKPAAAPPRARIVHQSPGRARLRVEGHRRDPAYFHGIAQRLRAVPGVSSVETNAETGSILIRHTADIGQLLSEARRNAIMVMAGEGAVMQSLSHFAVALTTGLDRELRKLSAGQLTLPLALSFTFFLLAVAKAVQGDFRASTLHLFLSALQAANARSRQEEGEEMAEMAGEIA